MKYRIASRLVALLVLGVALAFMFVPQAAAQGCALCYKTAAATGKQGTHTLNQAILVLLIPPLAIFLGIFAFFYRRRNAARLDDTELTTAPSLASSHSSV